MIRYKGRIMVDWCTPRSQAFLARKAPLEVVKPLLFFDTCGTPGTSGTAAEVIKLDRASKPSKTPPWLFIKAPILSLSGIAEL